MVVVCFDALGRHATRVFNGTSTDTYRYVGSGETAWRIETGGGPTRTSGIGPDEARLSVGDGTSFAWTLPDLHGSTAAGVNAAETAISHAWRYDGYGRLVASESSSLANPWLYQGRLQLSPDNAHPLYEFSARFYDPNLGVFTQLDTYAGAAQDPMSLNRYLYAAANPATLIDPTGHKFEREAGYGSSGGGGGSCSGNVRCGSVRGADINPRVTAKDAAIMMGMAITGFAGAGAFARLGVAAIGHAVETAATAAAIVKTTQSAPDRVRAAAAYLTDRLLMPLANVLGAEAMGPGPAAGTGAGVLSAASTRAEQATVRAWQAHEGNVTRALQAANPGARIAQQVTLDVHWSGRTNRHHPA